MPHIHSSTMRTVQCRHQAHARPSRSSVLSQLTSARQRPLVSVRAAPHDHIAAFQEQEQRGGWSSHLSTAAALIILCCGGQPALAAHAPLPFDQIPMSEEERAYDENLMTAELRSFVDLLQSKGSNIKADEVEAPRLKLGIQRGVDGRVSLRARTGDWYKVKADMQASGFLLLREESSGTMFFLPPDDGGQLQQVDLSDDAVVAQLFASGAWFDVMEPLEVESGSGLKPLQLSASEFRLTTTLLEDAVEPQ